MKALDFLAPSEDDEKALDAERTASVEAPEPEPVAEVEAEAPTAEPEKKEHGAKSRARREDGTFLPKDAKPEPVVEKPAEKPVETPQKVEAPAKPPEGYVAHGAFHEERERRKALQKQVEAMENRWKELVEKMQAPKPQVPDPSQDFAGHTLHRLGAVDQTTSELAQRVQGFEQFHAQQAEEARFMQAYSLSANEFAAQQPDFGQAYQFWLKARFEELTDAGYTPQQALQIRTAEERGIVGKAFEDGVNPGQRLYAVAKRRGYTVASAPAASAAPSQAPAVVEQPPVNPAAEKLERIAAGQRATPALGGGAQKGKLTLSAIAAMDEKEFNSLDWERTMRELTP